jgi:transposase
MVRFEGVAGEFAQFDFGVADVRLLDAASGPGPRRRLHFAAYRLKWSRFVHVVVVPNERVEALVRALLASFAAGGGVPLRVVFDNPKTVVLRHDAGRPVWNATLAQAMLDYGCGIELCTPRTPQQKGSVENLVGFVKRTFFTARRFRDLDTDCQGSPSLTQLAITQRYAPGLVVRLGESPPAGVGGGAAGGGVRSLSSSRSR